MIALVDYGLGNIAAFANIFRKLNRPVIVAGTPDQLELADRIILPGVGAFDWAMTRLNESGMRESLDALVLEKKRPVLGVCVGMQMMARRSEEGELDGLGWIDADVWRFSESAFTHRAVLPHMGWNDAQPRNSAGLFDGLVAPRFYFLHSYHLAVDDPRAVVAETVYGDVFPSAVGSGNVFGTQFHPEKSHHWGIRLLQNFAEL